MHKSLENAQHCFSTFDSHYALAENVSSAFCKEKTSISDAGPHQASPLTMRFHWSMSITRKVTLVDQVNLLYLDRLSTFFIVRHLRPQTSQDLQFPASCNALSASSWSGSRGLAIYCLMGTRGYIKQQDTS